MWIFFHKETFKKTYFVVGLDFLFSRCWIFKCFFADRWKFPDIFHGLMMHLTTNVRPFSSLKESEFEEKSNILFEQIKVIVWLWLHVDVLNLQFVFLFFIGNQMELIAFVAGFCSISQIFKLELLLHAQIWKLVKLFQIKKNVFKSYYCLEWQTVFRVYL